GLARGPRMDAPRAHPRAPEVGRARRLPPAVDHRRGGRRTRRERQRGRGAQDLAPLGKPLVRRRRPALARAGEPAPGPTKPGPVDDRLRLRRDPMMEVALGRIAPLPIAALLLAAAAAAQERPTIVVTPGSKQTYRAAVQRFADHSPRPAGAERFRDDLGRALEFSQVFELVNARAFLGPETTESLEKPIVCPDWSQIGAD